MVFGEIDAPLEDVGIHGAGGTLVLAGDNLHPVAAAESVVETHALQGICLAGAGARNGCQSVPYRVPYRCLDIRTNASICSPPQWPTRPACWAERGNKCPR